MVFVTELLGPFVMGGGFTDTSAPNYRRVGSRRLQNGPVKLQNFRHVIEIRNLLLLFIR